MKDQSIYKARLKIGEVEFEVEGDKGFVQEQITVWKTKEVQDFRNLIASVSNSKTLEKKSSQSIASKEFDLGKMDLPEFYQKYNVISHPDRVAIIGYFLEKSAGKELFTAQDMLEAYDQIRIQPPKNIHDVLSKVYKRNGYILPKGKGAWKLSSKGIELVEANKGSKMQNDGTSDE